MIPHIHTVLVVAMTILAVSIQNEAAPMDYKMANTCKECELTSVKSLVDMAVCRTCGQMYGFEMEYCCLCADHYFRKCTVALRK